jgi:hypothetical protein
MKPRSDLSETRLLSLAQQRSRSSIAFGGKSANLGEVLNAQLARIIVPSGFTIPFYYYDEFIKRNNLDDASRLLNDQKFVHDPAYRASNWSRIATEDRSANSIRAAADGAGESRAVNTRARACLCAALRTRKTCRTSVAPVFTRQCQTCAASSS